MVEGSDDEIEYDGPNIRPPQPGRTAVSAPRRDAGHRGAAAASSKQGSSRHSGGAQGAGRSHARGSDHPRRDQRDRDSRRDRGGDRRDRDRRGGGGGGGGGDGQRSRRVPIQAPDSGDLRDRLGSRSKGPRGMPDDDEKRMREERLKKLMLAEATSKDRQQGSSRSKADAEEDTRKLRRAAEKELEKMESRMMRKRERSAERGEKKRKKRHRKSEEREEGEEEDEEAEEGEAEDSAEEGEEEESSGDEDDDDSDDEDDEEGEEEEESDDSDESDSTASEQSGATPERSEEEQEEQEPEEEVELEVAESKSKKHKKRKRKKHHRRQSSSSPPPRAAAEEHMEEGEEEPEEGTPQREQHDPDKTPERSPTPLRSEYDNLLGEGVEEDDEDSRLEAALRGELKTEAAKAEDNQDTPKSQGSFGDGIGDGDHEGKDDADGLSKSAKDERDRLPPYLPSVHGCRSVEEFHCMNRIEEGTYGVVYRARDKKTQEIVALKRLKMEREKEGFPITSLREINTLLISQHPNVVTVREIVVGSNMDKIFIVMDFVSHDLKSLMELMRKKSQVFLPGEIKCLMVQLLRAIHHLHDNWILHRDLKTSNILLSNSGIIKVGDFGLAREYGSPLKNYTAVVVTLWYRAPELLLGQKLYSTHIDVWSVGCIFGELIHMSPLFRGESDQDQLHKIFKLLGTPSEKIWPDYKKLPITQKVKFVQWPVSNLREKFPFEALSELGMELLKSFLTYDPKKRVTCDKALDHDYFFEEPRAIDPKMFPTWPAKSEQAAGSSSVKKVASPKPPSGGGAYKDMNQDELESKATTDGFSFVARNQTSMLPGWNLKF